MPSKKSQVTVFIIIGIIILLGIIFAVSISRMKLGKEVSVDAQTQPVNIYIQKCIEDVSLQGIYLLGVQGGYITPPNTSLVTDYAEIGYGYYLGESRLAPRALMEQQLSYYIDSNLLDCINNFSSFAGRNITFENPSSSVNILENNVLVNANFPVFVENSKLDKFSVEVPVRLGHIHDLAAQIIANTVKDPDWVDLGNLINYDVKVNVIPEDRENLVYSLSEGDFIFLFANKFAINNPPKLFLDNQYLLYDNAPWNLQVKYSSQSNVTFADDTPMFDITPTGFITFTPTVKGDFDVKITAVDTHGESASQNVLFKVVG